MRYILFALLCVACGGDGFEGPPPDAGPPEKSCYGRCDSTGLEAPGVCYCDSHCASAGDCCADYIQYCGAQ